MSMVYRASTASKEAMRRGVSHTWTDATIVRGPRVLLVVLMVVRWGHREESCRLLKTEACVLDRIAATHSPTVIRS